MILYRFLSIILLIVFVTAEDDTTLGTNKGKSKATTNQPTTIDSITEQDRIVTSQLESILATYESGEAYGNRELKHWLNYVKEASKWGKHKLVEKGQAIVLFNQYDRLRKDLEEQIHDRLEMLVDDLIPNEKPYSECWKFYMQQRNALRKALKKNNLKKTIIVEQNSKECCIEPNSSEEDE